MIIDMIPVPDEENMGVAKLTVSILLTNEL